MLKKTFENGDALFVEGTNGDECVVQKAFVASGNECSKTGNKIESGYGGGWEGRDSA